ncbi:MAG: hypothetical protein QOG04_1452 [Actinomycetota bacterium]|nr:hypothetical protein [Actinomycetota bacterium]
MCGYTQDNGEVYAARNGFSYGWNFNHTDGMRDRGTLADQLLDTLAHFHSGGKWEIAVPNGTHDVKVSIGDTSHTSSHTINVEGVNYWNNIFLNTYQFQQMTKTVTVNDGKITIDQGTMGNDMTHINYLEIDAVGTVPSCTVPVPVPTPTPSSSASASSTPTPTPTPSASRSATPTPTPSASKAPTPTPTPSPSLSANPFFPEIKVDFQLAGAPMVCGYLQDYGETYAFRNGKSYGWNFDHTDVTRDRNMSSNQLIDTLVYFKSGGKWEIEVANGVHQVNAVIGDAGFSSSHTLNVEGVNFWNNTYLGASEFVQATKLVTVNDGRLTLDAGTAPDKSTRLDYLVIDQDALGDNCVNPIITPTPSATPRPPTPVPSLSPTRLPTPGASITPTPEPTETAPPVERSRTVRINYQLAGSRTVCGYKPDYGESYGPRHHAEYGWNFSHEDVTRDREVRNEQRLDTLSHFHAGGVWELKIRKGLHEVTISIGDASFESDYTLNVEGVNFWDNIHLQADEFRQVTRQVQVNDGRLTLDQGTAYDKATRINYLTVNADGPPAGCDKPEPTPTPKPQPAEDGNGGGGGGTTGGAGGKLGARPYGLSGLVRVFGSRCSDKSNNARTWYPSAGGRGKYGYVYYHSKLARKVGGKVLGTLQRRHRTGAVDYGVWGYSCRIKRGGTSWSVHSWGVAIDTNTSLNPWQATRWNGRGSNGRQYGRMYPKIWLHNNFYWGINFRDPMHFQYVSGY